MSASDSPFWADDVAESAMPSDVPPTDAIAASKLRRVLVDGSRKR